MPCIANTQHRNSHLVVKSQIKVVVLSTSGNYGGVHCAHDVSLLVGLSECGCDSHAEGCIGQSGSWERIYCQRQWGGCPYLWAPGPEGLLLLCALRSDVVGLSAFISVLILPFCFNRIVFWYIGHSISLIVTCKTGPSTHQEAVCSMLHKININPNVLFLPTFPPTFP